MLRGITVLLITTRCRLDLSTSASPVDSATASSAVRVVAILIRGRPDREERDVRLYYCIVGGCHVELVSGVILEQFLEAGLVNWHFPFVRECWRGLRRCRLQRPRDPACETGRDRRPDVPTADNGDIIKLIAYMDL
jgi:hypothetical protein